MIKLIIEQPKLQTFQQKYTSIIIIVLSWLLWFYIWTPLFVFIFWALEINIMESDLFNYVGFNYAGFNYAGFEVFLIDIQQCFCYIAMFCLIFILWVVYNIYRFKNLCRYKNQKKISIKELSTYTKITKECLEECQQTTILTAQFDQQGQLIRLQNYPLYL